MANLVSAWGGLTRGLDKIGEFLPQLGLRLILGYEYLESGFTKLHGDNWFGHIQDSFIFPFNLLPADLNWFLATWGEIVGGFALIFGLATRFFSFTLVIVTIVAALAVHWPEQWDTLGELWRGYSISDKGYGNYKLPLLFLLMLLPLLFSGAGKLSLDHLLSRIVR